MPLSEHDKHTLVGIVTLCGIMLAFILICGGVGIGLIYAVGAQFK